MKRLLLLLFVSAGLTGCYIDDPYIGPQGEPGYDGLDGEESYVFDYTLSFTGPHYESTLILPDHFTMLDSDVIMVYLLWEVTDGGVEVWRALPQTVYFQDGMLSYNYDFTIYDVNIFLDGTINLDHLGAYYTDDWIARVVVIPGQFGGRTDVDITDYNSVIEYYNLKTPELDTKGYKKRPQ